jgi:hypothetical protein|tara:strand:- start:20 stop:220 length:201 start_codon:yes stop_codon:yes gene_type:complete
VRGKVAQSVLWLEVAPKLEPSFDQPAQVATEQPTKPTDAGAGCVEDREEETFVWAHRGRCAEEREQ